MVRPVVDLTDKALSGEERVAGVTALGRGLNSALTTLLQGVRTYHDLIADELEGRPGAEAYLSASRAMLDRALAWLDAFARSMQDSGEFERIDLRPLMEGVVKRCRRIVPPSVDIGLYTGPEPVIAEGALSQLQDAMLGMLQHCVEGPGTASAAVHLCVGQTEFIAHDVDVMRCCCEPGLYAVVHVHATAGAPFLLSDCVGFWDGIKQQAVVDADVELRLLHVYGVLLGHGGDVFFGREGSDLIMAVALPAEAKREEMQVDPNIEDANLCGTETVLLVDDEDMIWDVIIDMLQELGYSVILAGNGAEAVEIYRANPDAIDLVMLDMRMPVMDGREAFKKLKEIDPNVRVLVSSGYVAGEEAQEVLSAGAAGALQKPYRMGDLARKIRSIFDAPAR